MAHLMERHLQILECSSLDEANFFLWRFTQDHHGHFFFFLKLEGILQTIISKMEKPRSREGQ